MLGDDDISGLIDSWEGGEIRFHLPAGAHSSPVFLQGPLVASSGFSDGALGRLLSLGREITGLNLRSSPGAFLGVIYPPVIRLFRVNGKDVTDQRITLEACRDSVRVVWQVGMVESSRQTWEFCRNVNCWQLPTFCFE